MKNTLILLFILFSSLLYSCKKEGFKSFLESAGADAISFVELYPNSSVLMANGKAEISFKVKAFMETENEKGEKDTVLYNLDKLKPEQLKITSSRSEIIEGNRYKTNDLNNGAISFTCAIGDKVSKPAEVKLIKPDDLNFESITVPVIFHILHEPGQEAAANGVSVAFLQELINRLNKVFSNSLINAPSAIDTKVKFVLKTRNVKNIGKLNNTEINTYILKNSVTDPFKSLNIWICNTTSSAYTSLPSYTVNENVLIGGLKLNYIQDQSTIAFTNPNQAGILLPLRSIFSIAQGGNPRIEYVMGQFFGLIPTGALTTGFPYINGDVDYCSDTYTYEKFYLTPEKWIYNPTKIRKVYYDSFNIMDEYTASTTISYEQALRIRKVIENCPLRQFK